mmetsp:Transcript_42840/g.118420  ORF Transcript_42840/g.118420 Transcript_42840/m.118420 type:complete len:392 (-) Transcript_42840:74-1249(-)
MRASRHPFRAVWLPEMQRGIGLPRGTSDAPSDGRPTGSIGFSQKTAFHRGLCRNQERFTPTVGVFGVASALATWARPRKRGRRAGRTAIRMGASRGTGVDAGARPRRAKGFGAKKPSASPKQASEGSPSEETVGPVDDALRCHTDDLIAGLRERGWWASDGPVLPAVLRRKMRNEVEALWAEGRFATSQSVRAGGEYYDKKNVFATEVSRETYDTAPRLVHYTVEVAKALAKSVCAAFPDVELSSSVVGNKLNLCTGNGASFDSHLDVGVAERPFHRKLTLLLYLNTWRPELGGELVLLGEGGTEAEAAARIGAGGDDKGFPAQLAPTDGRWVAFWSDRVLHRVEPSLAPEGLKDFRCSYTIWFCANEADGRVTGLGPGPGYEAAPSFASF